LCVGRCRWHVFLSLSLSAFLFAGSVPWHGARDLP
jgi:hypothetical protein